MSQIIAPKEIKEVWGEDSKGTNRMTMMITRGNQDSKAKVMPAMDFMKSFPDPMDRVVVPLVAEGV
jgi:hypothetical protein